MNAHLKIAFLVLISLLDFNLLTYAQKSSQGIYLSANDFRQDKISFGPHSAKKYKIYADRLFNKSLVKINTRDSIYTFCKDSIYAYRDEENTIYRFFQNDSYQILNPNESILLYRQTHLGGYKNLESIATYYFSSTSSSAILPLTKQNIKTNFPEEILFQDLLDIYFKEDNDLLNFDTARKQYKLNRVYQLAKEIILKN